MYTGEEFNLYSRRTLISLIVALVVFIVMIVMAICMPNLGGMQWIPVGIIAILFLLLLLVRLFANLGTHSDDPLYPIVTRCTIDNKQLKIDNQVYPFNRYSLHPVGFTNFTFYHTNTPNWSIEVVEKEDDGGVSFFDKQSQKKAIPLLSRTKYIKFKCSQNKYRELADCLMRFTQKKAPDALQLDFTDHEDRYKPDSFLGKIIVSFFLAIMLSGFAVILLALLSLIHSFLSPGLESDFFLENLLPIVICISVIIFIVSLIYYSYKDKKTIPVNTISIDNNKLIINGEDFDWQEIKELRLSCGWTDQNQGRMLSITTEHVTRRYAYVLYFGNDGQQKTIEKWFYYKLGYRFTPVFDGKKFVTIKITPS